MSSGSAWREPRQLAFHVLTALAVVVCVVAARWQWDRANRTEADAVPAGPVVALADLDLTATYSGMRVAITGEFDPAHEVLVAPRPREEQAGAWVFTPLLPESSDGSVQPAVGIVRGWIPAGSLPEAPPSGAVTVVGILVADARQPGAVPAGDPPAMVNVDTGALAEVAGYPVRSGWFALHDMHPAGAGQPLPLLVTELPGAEVGLNWRNAAYAVQWIVFAGFALFFWNRFRREYVERPAEQELPR